jgi:hypothetical protein
MRSAPARAICDDVERGGMLGIASKLTKPVSLYTSGQIGKQSGKRQGPNEDQKDPHWTKLASRQVLFNLIEFRHGRHA